jgi:hypothetical protein
MTMKNHSMLFLLYGAGPAHMGGDKGQKRQMAGSFYSGG